MHRYYKQSYLTEAERIARQKEHDIALQKLQTMTPRKTNGKPPGEPPFGLGILAGLGQKPPKPISPITGKPVSRPYKQQAFDKGGVRQGQGKLVSQVTPGKLRKEPDVIQSLIKAIYDFFDKITNRPEPVDRFMAKYPKPATT